MAPADPCVAAKAVEPVGMMVDGEAGVGDVGAEREDGGEIGAAADAGIDGEEGSGGILAFVSVCTRRCPIPLARPLLAVVETLSALFLGGVGGLLDGSGIGVVCASPGLVLDLDLELLALWVKSPLIFVVLKLALSSSLHFDNPISPT